ncbi:flavodoxin [Listeria immobilis]|uniref:flavodoxin n=1 Tax=Listeria immobilis TaxID=2713502 RepID=UPI00162374DE|nr:flavodoxin [Listeria immobilis]MBC1516306.1 hypothetical protein [Listeria immobilis]
MTIILYFSRKDENFVDGEIKTLSSGNTEIVAEKIGQKIGAPSFEIVPKVAYPYDYQEVVKLAQKEKTEGIKPLYQTLNIHLDHVANIFLGFPNWFGSMPQIVAHFLEKTDLAGKNIYPFCTHEGSAFGFSLMELREICPDSNIQLGLPVRGSRVAKADEAIANWLAEYKMNGGKLK